MNWDDIGKDFVSVLDDRVDLLIPIILKVSSNITARSIADVGGGDGRFLAELRRANEEMASARFALIDPSPTMRLLAHTSLAHVSGLQICDSTTMLPQGGWDLVLSIAVWMSIETEQECIAHLESLNCLLSERGRIIIAVTHPCFRDRMFHTYSTNFDMRHYMDSGKRFKATVFDGKRSIIIDDTHWTVSDHLRQLAHAGLVIEDLIEVADEAQVSPGAPWLVFVCKRK